MKFQGTCCDWSLFSAVYRIFQGGLLKIMTMYNKNETNLKNVDTKEHLGRWAKQIHSFEITKDSFTSYCMQIIRSQKSIKWRAVHSLCVFKTGCRIRLAWIALWLGCFRFQLFYATIVISKVKCKNKVKFKLKLRFSLPNKRFNEQNDCSGICKTTARDDQVLCSLENINVDG